MINFLGTIIQGIDLDNPCFEKAAKVHDWRNHVPDLLKQEWNTLTEREKRIIYYISEFHADNEVWD